MLLSEMDEDSLYEDDDILIIESASPDFEDDAENGDDIQKNSVFLPVQSHFNEEAVVQVEQRPEMNVTQLELDSIAMEKRPRGRRGKGVKKDGSVSLTASSDVRTIHINFVLFWAYIDCPQQFQEILADIKERWRNSAALMAKEPEHINDALRTAVNELRDAENFNVEKFMLEFIGCKKDNGKQKMACLLSDTVVRSGGHSAGLERFKDIKDYLYGWISAFRKTTMMYDKSYGVGLKARRRIKAGDVICDGFIDDRAPLPIYSTTPLGWSLLGPLALVNCGCKTHINARRNEDHQLIASRYIKAESMILTKNRAHGEDSSMWTCASRCNKRIVTFIDRAKIDESSAPPNKKNKLS
uniref:SET domain-containing protein n=2 Tax=Aureoumbra lagunensis TaxID=44058 RepID=A0A7S3K1E7_9STRA|mmetsp:Transcript_2694/g.4299  ORF Transcript_2694/g.4299 Transcript_2694/m.4299 type:complete len:355 (-) Transcript_2694:406-1470(-)